MTKLSGKKCSIYYDRYIKSIKWVSKSTAWKRETGKCETCGTSELLTVHHLHYRTLGAEKREDVQVLCRKCHFKTHEDEAARSAYWRGYDTWCRRGGRDPEVDHTDDFDEFIERRAYR